MADDISSPKEEVNKSKAPDNPEAQPSNTENAEEVDYESYSEAVTAYLNEAAQLAAPFLDSEFIGMVTIVAVSADGSYAQSHEVSKIPESAGDDKAEQTRIRRMNAGSRLQTAMELQKHKARLMDKLKHLIKELDG